MLWPLMLPFTITFWSLIAIIVLATATAPKFGKSRKRVFIWSLLLSLLGFVPLCGAMMMLLDQYRFGVFQYPDFDSVKDFRVERYLPKTATNITVQKYAQGYRAKFTISKESLNEWFDQLWERSAEYSVIPRTSIDASKPVDPNRYTYRFDGLNWPPLEDAIEYEGPAASNGAGFTIWYNAAEGVAYQEAGYW